MKMSPKDKTAKTNIIASPGKQEIIVTYVFDAPRELVFKVCTEPKLIQQWWGPKRFTVIVDRMDARPGGIWRFINRDSEGNEYAFRGVFHDIVPPERTVKTFEFEGMPGHVALETATLEDLNGKTKLTVKSVFQSVEDRDAMFNSGMEEGVIETLERLAELLAKESERKS